MRSTASVLFVLCCFGLLLSGCGKKDLGPLPEGIQTVEGTLEPAELSALRRGTHVIRMNGKETYYAESTVVPLRKYQGKKVTLRGILEHNVDASYLPVLVVDSVLNVEETSVQQSFPELSLSLTAPVNWKPVKAGGSVFFTLSEGGPVIMKLSQSKGDELPEGGEPIVVGAKRASRMIDALTGNVVVHIQQASETILTLSFTPDTESDSDAQLQDFQALLATFSFTEKAQTHTPVTGTGAVGAPCGGTAGVLCPAGMFCEITNFSENIGRCKKL